MVNERALLHLQAFMEEYKSKYLSQFILSIILLALLIGGVITPAIALADNTIDVWWPTNGAHVSGTQPFKAVIPGLDIAQYQMFWQVDNGTWNWMSENDTDSPHMEASVDLTGWMWDGSGPYTVNFIARQGNQIISQQSETIFVDNGSPAQTDPQGSIASSTLASPNVITIMPADASSSSATSSDQTTSSTPATTASATSTATTTQSIATAATPTTSVIAVATTIATQTLLLSSNQNSNENYNNSSMSFYIEPNTEASLQQKVWGDNNATDASAMQTLAQEPTAVWFGNWNTDMRDDVHSLVASAQASNAMPVLVAYNIPERDCGGFSSGGSDNPSGYQSWIDSFSQGLGQAPATRDPRTGCTRADQLSLERRPSDTRTIAQLRGKLDQEG